MSRDGKAASKGFGRRQEDRVTPEERIYPLQFILDYVQEKKNTLLYRKRLVSLFPHKMEIYFPSSCLL